MGKPTKWVCTNCEYIYEPEYGDTNNDIETRTKFEELPKDWVCPICWAGKNLFKPYKKRNVLTKFSFFIKYLAS